MFISFTIHRRLLVWTAMKHGCWHA
jgi:hypothetical protein